MRTCLLLSSLFFGVPAIVLATTLPASATLIGDTIVADAVWRDFGLPGNDLDILAGESATVSASDIEYSVPIPGLGGSNFSIDFFGDETFTIVVDPADFGIWPLTMQVDLTDLDWVGSPGELTSVSLDSASVTGLLDTINFTADSISLTSAGSGFASGARFTLNYSYTARHSEVPEPATAAILCLGLAALGAIWRRRSS